MLDRLPNWLRWAVLLPVSIGTAFVVATGIAAAARGLLTYPAVFLSGWAYVFSALYAAARVAPSHRRIVLVVLGTLILGDLAFVHLVMSPDMLAASADSGLGVLMNLLRADDYRNLRYGGAVKVIGALCGLAFTWWMSSRVAKRARQPNSGSSPGT